MGTNTKQYRREWQKNRYKYPAWFNRRLVNHFLERIAIRTQPEVGKILGITAQSVSQIEKHAIGKILRQIQPFLEDIREELKTEQKHL